MNEEKETSIDEKHLKKSESKTYFKVAIAGLIGAILGIIAYTNNWLG